MCGGYYGMYLTKNFFTAVKSNQGGLLFVLHEVFLL